MAAGTPLSAKACNVRVNGNVYYAQEWNVDAETDFDDTTNFESGGFQQQVACIEHAEVTIRGWWDAGANPHDAPLNLQAGNTLTTVKLYTSGVTSPFWSFPVLKIKGTPWTVRVKEKIMFEVRGVGDGTFAYPTGNAA